MAAAGIILTKGFTYRGAFEEWANVYHFTGIEPNHADRVVQVNDLIDTERDVVAADTQFIRALLYDNLDGHHAAVDSVDVASEIGVVSGTLTSTGAEAPGDAATYAWWKTDRLTSKGKPVYLRKFFHNAFSEGATADAVAADVAAALDTFAFNMSSSPFGPSHFTFTGPVGTEAILATGHGPWVTTRTLKRRGRRP